jgi:uncharacterized protein (TIGR02996 family)
MREEAFHFAMRDDPDNSAPRLIFADWLEEQDDPRGELLRLGHALTQSVHDPGRPAREARLRELMAAGIQPVGPHYTNSLGMRFAWVPPGVFLRGSPPEEGERRDDEDLHPITLTRGFYIGVETVTQAQWRAVMGDRRGRFPGDDRTVECVSWEDCQDFCENLSRISGLGREAPYPYHLPTEAQWEYGCRSGTTSAFFFGDNLTADQANYHANGRGGGRKETAPPGAFPANAWGLRAMHGNVFEWCADWYGPYPQGAVQNPSGPPTGDVRVLRGGSWNSLLGRCRSACRGWAAPGYRGSDVGFRVCFRVDDHYVI